MKFFSCHLSSFEKSGQHAVPYLKRKKPRIFICTVQYVIYFFLFHKADMENKKIVNKHCGQENAKYF